MDEEEGNVARKTVRLKCTCARGPFQDSHHASQSFSKANSVQLSMASPTFPVLPIQKFAGRNAPVRRPTVSTYLICLLWFSSGRPPDTPCAHIDFGEGNHPLLIRRCTQTPS